MKKNNENISYLLYDEEHHGDIINLYVLADRLFNFMATPVAENNKEQEEEK